MASNSTREHSTDQAKGTDVDVGDGEGWSGGSAVVECGYRGKAVGSVGSDGGQARLRENRDWLTPNGQPLAHPSGDNDGWVPFAGVGNMSSAGAHTLTDRVCWSRPAATEWSEGRGGSGVWLFWPRRQPSFRARGLVGSESRWGSRRASSSTSSMKKRQQTKART